MEERPLQPQKAPAPMSVTLLGIVIEARPVHFMKAASAIPTVPSLIFMDVLLGIVPLYLYAKLPAYTNPSVCLLYHPEPSKA